MTGINSVFRKVRLSLCGLRENIWLLQPKIGVILVHDGVVRELYNKRLCSILTNFRWLKIVKTTVLTERTLSKVQFGVSFIRNRQEKYFLIRSVFRNNDASRSMPIIDFDAWKTLFRQTKDWFFWKEEPYHISCFVLSERNPLEGAMGFSFIRTDSQQKWALWLRSLQNDLEPNGLCRLETHKLESGKLKIDRFRREEAKT